MELTIRPTTMDDLSALDGLFARAYPRLLKADYPPSVMVTALPLISRAKPELLRCGTYYLAETSGGRLLGAGGWTPDRDTDGLAHIRHVVTDDRMVRRGIGRAILTHAMQTAREAGVHQIECWSTLTGVPFYRSLGFHELGPIDVELAPGVTFPSVRMMATV